MGKVAALIWADSVVVVAALIGEFFAGGADRMAARGTEEPGKLPFEDHVVFSGQS